jgi:hypothetical protein
MSRLTCADRSGFLFAHACDRPAAGTCSLCHKAICLEHTRMTASGPTCITCMRSDREADVEDDDAGGEDDPYFQPGVDRAAYYDADDYRAFDPAAPETPEEPETATGAS